MDKKIDTQLDLSEPTILRFFREGDVSLSPPVCVRPVKRQRASGVGSCSRKKVFDSSCFLRRPFPFRDMIQGRRIRTLPLLDQDDVLIAPGMHNLLATRHTHPSFTGDSDNMVIITCTDIQADPTQGAMFASSSQ